jgi:hypothetical protein
MNNKIKTKNILPKTTKTLKGFLSSEEGRISKEKVVKFGLIVATSATILSGIMKPDKSLAACSHSSHGSHGSHGVHSSHGSHGSHGQW